MTVSSNFESAVEYTLYLDFYLFFTTTPPIQAIYHFFFLWKKRFLFAHKIYNENYILSINQLAETSNNNPIMKNFKLITKQKSPQLF